MKIIVTHNSPDWDAITSVWLLKKYLLGWENAIVNFVPAGTKLTSANGKDVLHVDTGLGPLDHHQTSDMNICAASLAFDYIKGYINLKDSDKLKVRLEALQRIVKYVVALDHFQEVFWPDAAANYQEFNLFGILEGYKTQYPNQDAKYVEFGFILLDAILHRMEEVIWAEREIKEKGKEFDTRFGKGLGIETLNDEVIKLAQKTGYVIVIRKDPRKGYVRIKALPARAEQISNIKYQISKINTVIPSGSRFNREKSRDPLTTKEDSGQARMTDDDIDLTLIKEQLSKMDPHATWFLHVSKRMLLNGTPKNPKMIPTTLSLQEILDVVKRI